MSQLAFTVKQAAAHVGVNDKVIHAAIKRGDLIARYPNSRAIIERAELENWLTRLPTEAKH